MVICNVNTMMSHAVPCDLVEATHFQCRDGRLWEVVPGSFHVKGTYNHIQLITEYGKQSVELFTMQVLGIHPVKCEGCKPLGSTLQRPYTNLPMDNQGRLLKWII